MGKIVAIGGGSFDSMGPLLQQVIELCDGATPTVTVVPTAASTPDGEKASYELWRGIFSEFTPNVCPLLLLKDPPPQNALKEALEKTDAVYVPGGNARFMLQTWRKVGLDRVFRRAFRHGVVLSGRSAGANGWFKYSLGAEPPRPSARFFSFRRNRGLGLVDSVLCTHYQDRREPFRVLLETFGGTGIGLDDGVALVIEDNTFSVVSAGPGQAYAVSISEVSKPEYPMYKTLSERILEAGAERRPLRDLGVAV